MEIEIVLTRDSVAAGDDVEAPHTKGIFLSSELKVSDLADRILSMRYLANISGGQATWSVASTIPLAVIAQQWDSPKVIAWNDPAIGELAKGKTKLQVHCNYHAQIDPDVAYEVLKRFKNVGG